MAEQGMYPNSPSTLLGVGASRVGEYLSGKCKSILKTAREQLKVDIKAAIVVGI